MADSIAQETQTYKEFLSTGFKASSKNNERFHEAWFEACDKNGKMAKQDKHARNIMPFVDEKGTGITWTYNIPKRGDTLVLCASGPSF
jgi:hypothetical protein